MKRLGEVIRDILFFYGVHYHFVTKLFPQEITYAECESLSIWIGKGLEQVGFPKFPQDGEHKKMYEVAKIVVDMCNREMSDVEAAMKVTEIFKVPDGPDVEVYKVAKIIVDMCRQKLTDVQAAAKIHSLLNIRGDRNEQISQIISLLKQYNASRANGRLKSVPSNTSKTKVTEEEQLSEPESSRYQRDFD